MNSDSLNLSRRGFLAAGAALIGSTALTGSAAEAPSAKIVVPPTGKRILLSCKLGMIARERDSKKLSAADRLSMAAEAGFDGVDFDQAGEYTPEQARAAVQESGVFVHNAINHAHWDKRLTSTSEADREQGRKNLEHCIRVSHAAGGSGVLLVVGRGSDGEGAEERARQEIRKVLPMAAAYGQMVLFENVWNEMMYDHDKPAPPEQPAFAFIQFVDSFRSPWAGMYYDIGNHWKYGQPGEWIRAFGHRCVKLDVKGFSRANNKFVDITSEDDDLPWKEVRKALDDIGFEGWATAEVGGGDVKRLKVVREQMQRAFQL